MSPQGGESNNNQPAGQTAVLNGPLGVRVAPSESSVGLSDPLANLQNVVDVARQEAVVSAAPQSPTEETPQKAFQDQFGSGAMPTVTELKPEDSTDTSVGQVDPGINTVDDLLAKEPQVVENPNPAVEAVAPAEKTPADILKEQIAASVDVFLEKVLQK